MNSHFFYPTASGSLGEARRLGCEETIVKRESENPAPQMRVNQPPVQPQPRAQPARAPARVEAKPAQGGNPKNAPQPQGDGKRHP